MTRKNNIRRMFLGGNTSKGFVSFFDNILSREANRRFIIKGGPGSGKSTFMKKTADDILKLGYCIEYFHCSSDSASLDGVGIPALGIALVDGTSPHVIEPKYPGVIDEIINFSEYWDSGKIKQYGEDIIDTQKRATRAFRTAYSYLNEAMVAYEEYKSYINEGWDITKYNKMVDCLLENVFSKESIQTDKVENSNKYLKERNLFASAISPQGLCNYIETLISDKMKVYGLKGHPGSGVKKAIMQISKYASIKGLYNERFHCPFEPDKLDMVIIPSIDTAVINATMPYHYDIEKIKSEVDQVHIYDFDELVEGNIITKYTDELEYAEMRFSTLIDKAVTYIRKAKTIHDELEKYYVSSMNFEKVELKRQEIINTIFGTNN